MTSSESPLVTPPPKKEAFIKRWLKTSLFLVTCALLGKAGMMVYQSRSDGIPLAIKWEGAWLDANTRDVGASVNQCLGKPLLKEGILQRANVWFSGWSCAKVGSPDVIYSLNFDPARHERYFCMDENAQKIGQHFGSTVLHDLEFLETWSNPAMRETACQYLRSSFQSIAEGKKVLVHCDAGRDRTGTYAALVTALVAEARGQLDETMLDAIACDYQKTPSLTPDKYGRMHAFIKSLAQAGGIRAFLAKTCDLSSLELDAVIEKMASNAGP